MKLPKPLPIDMQCAESEGAKYINKYNDLAERIVDLAEENGIEELELAKATPFILEAIMAELETEDLSGMMDAISMVVLAIHEIRRLRDT